MIAKILHSRFLHLPLLWAHCFSSPVRPPMFHLYPLFPHTKDPSSNFHSVSSKIVLWWLCHSDFPHSTAPGRPVDSEAGYSPGCCENEPQQLANLIHVSSLHKILGVLCDRTMWNSSYTTSLIYDSLCIREVRKNYLDVQSKVFCSIISNWYSFSQLTKTPVFHQAR